jgi:ABC-type uncharacterized transport system fused permease/ATPase subunit
MTRDTAAPQGSALGAIHALLGIIRGSSGRRRLTILAMGLVVIIVATALAQLRLNTWQRDFYDALAQRNFRLSSNSSAYSRSSPAFSCCSMSARTE